MGDQAADNKVDAARHVYGPRPIGALVPGITRPAFKKRSPAGAQVLADWATIVGPELSATTTPRRLIAGTLTLACSGPVAMELQHLSGQVIDRVNSHLGRILIERLRAELPVALEPWSLSSPVDGLVAYDAAELPGLLGRSTRELGLREVVHRDDLVLL